MFKVRIGDAEPVDVATLRLGWRAIADGYAGLPPEKALTWSIEAFDGSFHRETLTRDDWEERFPGPLAFSRFLSDGDWRDSGRS
ncbi:hypothetical protein [Thiohalorhabdus sp.]|uniref:hypothetical protein n=1 Tax=Thiohalorhabdus sp. TaxID=3094134 RepID=UPI002FC35CD2